jgi:hypothetical protein
MTKEFMNELEEMVSNMQLAELYDSWNETEQDESTQAYIIRSTIMKEIESRLSEEEFMRWLRNEYNKLAR